MPERYYEDFAPGQVLPLGEREITKDEIIAYASVYDAQPFHIDEAAAKKLMLGGLAASGWHTACVIMRMNYDSWLKDTASLGAPGIDELRWTKPVRPGAVLHVDNGKAFVREDCSLARVNAAPVWPAVSDCLCHLESPAARRLKRFGKSEDADEAAQGG